MLDVVAGLVASELLKGLTSEVGKDVYAKSKQVISALKNRFIARPAAVNTIAEFEANPTYHCEEFKIFLANEARSDPEFRRIIESIKINTSPAVNIGTFNSHTENIHGDKTTNSISAGGNVIQGDATIFGINPKSR